MGIPEQNFPQALALSGIFGQTEAIVKASRAISAPLVITLPPFEIAVMEVTVVGPVKGSESEWRERVYELENRKSEGEAP